MSAPNLTLLETLRLWQSAILSWNKKEKNEALAQLENITEPDAKILYNIAIAHLGLGNLRDARQFFTLTISKDNHFALAYFQRGLTQYKLGRYGEALTDFEDAEVQMRGRKFIDYTQLGLRHKLHGFEVMYNAALCHYRLGNKVMGAQVMEDAKNSTAEKRHVAITDGASKIEMGRDADIYGESFTSMFQPSKNKVANLSKKDYLGSAKVISSVDSSDLTSGFAGPTRVDQGKLSPRVPRAARKMSAPEISLHKTVNSTNGSKNSGNKVDVQSELSKVMLQMAGVGQRLTEVGEESNDVLFPLTNQVLPVKPEYLRRRRGTAPQLDYDSYMEQSYDDFEQGDLKAVHDIPKVMVDDCDSTPPLYPPPRPPLGSSNAPTRPLPVPADVNPPPRPPKSTSPLPKSFTPERSPSPMSEPPPRPTSVRPTFNGVQSLENGRSTPELPSSSDSSNRSHPFQKNIASSLPAPPNRPPPKLVRESFQGKRAPPPPARPPKPQKVVIKFHCNSTENVQVDRGESVSSLIRTAQQLFELEPNTFNLWSRDTDDGEWLCIISDSDMLKIWAQTNLIQLWCFNKE